MATCTQQTWLGLGSADHLKEDLTQYWVSPLRIEVLEQPARSFYCQDMGVAETGVVELGRQFSWVVQIRGRKVLAVGAAVLTVRKILPDNWCVPRVSEEMAHQAIKSGGKPRNGSHQHDTVRAQDAPCFPQRLEPIVAVG